VLVSVFLVAVRVVMLVPHEARVAVAAVIPAWQAAPDDPLVQQVDQLAVFT
jgi:hypothetical protein